MGGANQHLENTECRSAKIIRWVKDRSIEDRNDFLVREEPLEIRLVGRSIAVTMRTPGRDAELAAGFLLTEGIIQKPGDILGIAHCREGEAAQHGNILNVFPAPDVEVDFERLTRHVFASSSCGLCGKASIESVHQHFSPVDADLTLTCSQILMMESALSASQETFALTGGLHAAAVFDEKGRLVSCREDVGRHNAVDKVIGHGLLNGLLPYNRHVLMVSGRASFEIMQKALAAHIPVVAAVSAPSSLAVDFANESGQTLIGFLRKGSFNVYANPQRVRMEDR